MPKFIKLTYAHGGEVSVDTSKIGLPVSRCFEGKTVTVLRLENGRRNESFDLRVMESPAEILALIEKP